MIHSFKKEGEFKFIEIGEGRPLIILHGLMGGLSNFSGVTEFFNKKGYKVILPDLPLYSKPLLSTNVKTFAEYIKNFIDTKGYNDVVLLGNSLGGHIGLLYTKLYPAKVKGLILTGSSGLYESAMGSGYTKRSDYEVMKAKVQEVFYDPEVATKELVDEVYATVNDRNKLIKTLAIAKSAIRHNMAKDLPNITTPSCIIWGKNDIVTPPDVGEEFNRLLPDSELFWIDKCGHAAMMEHPDTFNKIVFDWLTKRGL
jgi:pimeloyl-ACP methyl ester carboxylesterase|tara:strand:+ start:16274 stop:17038 length:765 start_codon:yes stop_codon:yes gene_type:complete